MWSSVIGHRRQIDQLTKALAAGRLPNAYLFAGPRGVGKRRVADALAAAIACLAPKDGAACGACLGCHKAGHRTHPDLFVVMPEAYDPAWVPPDSDGKKKPSEMVRIEQIRELQEHLQFHPLEAAAKLAIIDEADKMTPSTANSLLKILEEPPAATHFVLVSTAPQAILPTIRSRSARLDFGPLPNGDVAGELVRGGRMTRAEAERIAELAGGSLGTALSLDPQRVAETIGRLAAIARGASSADIIAVAEEWAHGDLRELRLTLDLVASFYRDVLRLLATGEERGLIHPEARETARGMTAGKAERALAAIADGRRTLETTANKQLMFEHLLFSVAG